MNEWTPVPDPDDATPSRASIDPTTPGSPVGDPAGPPADAWPPAAPLRPGSSIPAPPARPIPAASPAPAAPAVSPTPAYGTPSVAPAPPAYGTAAAPSAVPPPGYGAPSPSGAPTSYGGPASYGAPSSYGAPAAPYRVGGTMQWPSGPPGAAPPGPPNPGWPAASATPPAAPKRSKRRLVAALVAVVALVALIGGVLAVSGGDDDDPASAPGGASGSTNSVATTIPSGTPPVSGNGDEPIADVAAAVGPSVVLIATDEGEGSGIIYDKSGLIVTNAHVVGSSTVVAVQLADGTIYDDARVVGADSVRDVAVVKLTPRGDITPAAFGKTDDVRVGQTAVAIGSPFGLEQTVTAGIVSAVGRVISNTNPVEMIQTDAPINPGNSGGALADKQGRVIGMNTSIRTTSSGSGSVGVGFAVPADTFLAIAQRIVKGESLAVAFLGIRGSAPTGGGNQGVVISTVTAGSPAANAGLKAGDLITALNGTKVTTMLGMSARVQLQKPGDVIELTIERDGSTMKVKVTLGTLTR